MGAFFRTVQRIGVVLPDRSSAASRLAGENARPPFFQEHTMPRVHACPDPDRYRKLASGELPPEDRESLLNHLENCDRCAARVVALPNEDTLVELLREA